MHRDNAKLDGIAMNLDDAREGDELADWFKLDNVVAGSRGHAVKL